MFNFMILFNDIIDLILCRAFCHLLKRLTLLCFSTLTLRLINDFAKLLEKFMNHFFSNQIYWKTMASLISLRQKDREPLKDYLTHFN